MGCEWRTAIGNLAQRAGGDSTATRRTALRSPARRLLRPHDPRITERRNPRTQQIDLAGSLGIVDLINAEDRDVPLVVAAQRERIAEAIDAAEAVFRAGGRLFYVGAGTSGRLGVLDASECPPTFGTAPEMVQGIIAGGAPALTRAMEGAEDSLDQARFDLEARGVRAGDFVIGIAASGTTPYVRVALTYARSIGARTAIVACSPPPDETMAVVDIAIVAITGPEVVTGSTRLKAGTATKLILNTITTGAMIRLGKTYGNLMIDLRATNAKLVDRSERIVAEVCDVSRDEARDVLGRAGGSVKLAIVMHALGVDHVAAARKLDDGGGVIRRVVPGAPPPVA
ncbi:MAG: N-acetylmuramic acid 6-phosphate etherase [Gemmatimonadaceae bacterium]|nr:N-acetylmuramic acid 6-phosphate etherase [Gemmatimonadaceae bacterium]